MKKLLIADASEEFRVALQEYLQDSYQIQVCKEGNETLQMLESFLPDLVILDLMLPGVDGVTVLQKAADRGMHPTVLATSRFYSDYVIDVLERLNVGYAIVKPCEPDAVAARLADLLPQQKDESLEVKRPDLRTLVDNALRELSVQTHPAGYPCLREALLGEIRQPGQQVTKTLYPAVGKICGGSPEQVERAIRRLIKNAWLYRDQEVWDSYFGLGAGGTVTQCPTNKVFISTVAQRIAADEPTREVSSRKSG